MLITIIILQGIAVQAYQEGNSKSNDNSNENSYYGDLVSTLLLLKELGYSGLELIHALKDKSMEYETWGEIVFDITDISIDAFFFILEHLDDFLFCIIEEFALIYAMGSIPENILKGLYPLFQTIESWKIITYEKFESILNWTGERFFLFNYIKSWNLPFPCYFKAVDDWVRSLFSVCPSEYKAILRTLRINGGIEDLINLVKKLTELVKNHKPKSRSKT